MVLQCLGLCHSKHIESGFPSSGPTVIEELCHHFSLADLRKSTNNFDENRIIGEGGFHTVYKGCLQHKVATDCTVAVKRMKGQSVWRLEDFKNEIELLCQLRHPNLVSLIGFCNHKDENVIVYEYMSDGSLHDHLHNREMEPLSWKKRLEICIGAARGVHYLHTGAKRTIIHRDIKPSNILLDSNMVPKISGFGLCLQGPLFTSKPKPIEIDRIIGTYDFLAPEYALWGSLTDRSDVYSFGVVLIEVICAKSYTEISREMIEFQREELETTVGSEMSELPREEFETPICLEISELPREKFEKPICSEMSRLPSEEFEKPIRSADTHMSHVILRLRAWEIIDPLLAGKIAPECLELYIDIIDRCVKYEPNERSAMGEVEVELEHALTLQQNADARNTGGDYSLLSPSITQPL